MDILKPFKIEINVNGRQYSGKVVPVAPPWSGCLPGSFKIEIPGYHLGIIDRFDNSWRSTNQYAGSALVEAIGDFIHLYYG